MPTRGELGRKTAARKERFLAKYATGIGLVHAAEAVGVDRNTVWNWQQKDEEFAEAMLAAEERDTEQLEKRAKQRAMKSSDPLMVFLLKARRPGVYGDRVRADMVATVASLALGEQEPAAGREKPRRP